MNETLPLKRHEGLKDLSRDHHDGLLLCWKIREGLRRGTDLWRIKAYVNHVFSKSIQPHFQFEESHVFCLLQKNSLHRKRALADHVQLTKLFNQDNDLANTLPTIVTRLTEHIRFEERIVFEEIQKLHQDNALLAVHDKHKGKHKDTWPDRFWE